MIRLHMLMDNKALPGFSKEWGLAVAVETDNGLLLWDCGASGAFLNNAEAMEIDIRTAKAIALSHGHWDHCGGFSMLRKAGFSGEVFLHPAGLEQTYHVSPKEIREIGIPCALTNVKNVLESLELAPGITMITDIERIPGNHQSVDNFFQDREGTKPDFVTHDSFLLFTHGDTHSVLLGCCHAGLANSLEHLKKTTGVDTINTLVGGLHLFDASPEALEEAASAIERFGVRRIHASHCTGDRGYLFLRDRLDCEVWQTLSGTVIDLD